MQHLTKIQGENGPPQGAKVLGDGYILLRAMDRTARALIGPERLALKQFLLEFGVEVDDEEVLKVTKWSRLRLPNGQNARSAWKEKLKPLHKVRMSRNVKVSQ